MEHEQIRIRVEEGFSIIELAGQFVGGDETDALQEVLQDVANKETQVLIDMSDVSFANSSFLSALLSAHAPITRRGARLVIVGISPTIAQVFTITKLDLIFTIYDTIAQAFEHNNTND